MLVFGIPCGRIPSILQRTWRSRRRRTRRMTSQWTKLKTRGMRGTGRRVTRTRARGQAQEAGVTFPMIRSALHSQMWPLQHFWRIDLYADSIHRQTNLANSHIYLIISQAGLYRNRQLLAFNGQLLRWLLKEKYFQSKSFIKPFTDPSLCTFLISRCRCWCLSCRFPPVSSPTCRCFILSTLFR